MKIQSLKIKDIRGIRELDLNLDQESLVVYGQNGTGKSAVVDAIDFLFTGQINRLVGRGTKDVKLKKHGPHISRKKDLERAYVEAEIKIPGVKEIIPVSRHMGCPEELNYPSKYENELIPIIELVSRGQYVLTRREILQLVTSKTKDRGEKILNLLKLNEIEDARSTFVNLKNETQRTYERIMREVSSKQDIIKSFLEISNFEEEIVLAKINELREMLGVQPIEELKHEKILQNISEIDVKPNRIDHKQVNLQIDGLLNFSNKSNLRNVRIQFKKLEEIIAEIKGDPNIDWDTKRLPLTKEGIRIIRESGECPLCDTDWELNSLKSYLEERTKRLEIRTKTLESIKGALNENISNLKNQINLVEDNFLGVNESDEFLSHPFLPKFQEILQQWQTRLSLLKKTLNDLVEEYPKLQFSKVDTYMLFTPSDFEEKCKKTKLAVKMVFSEASPEQKAWTKLVSLNDKIRELEQSMSKCQVNRIVAEKAKYLEEAFINSRDKVLEDLYKDVEGRFVELYKEMHSPDEFNFKAELKPDGAGVNFKVNFHKYGLNPPGALHSEGHQDSMGVCLFLSLAEHLNRQHVSLIVLDDVVMSVDNGHRLAFCKVLKTHFPDHQFIITTHERVWAHQIRLQGVVKKDKMLKFSNWDVDSGPRINYEADMWKRIYTNMDEDDIPEAAHKLRRGLEEVSRHWCANLLASVPYRLDDKGGLGDFLHSAIGRYNKLLNKAINSAKSWGNEDTIVKLQNLKKQSSSIFERALGENWMVNSAIHFNEWADYSKTEFRHVVDAYKDMYDKVFSCEDPKCKSPIRLVSENGKKPIRLICNCGKYNWNLQGKKK